MLAVLGFILSVMLHLLLGILLFVLVILLMVLFVPIRYWFDGHRLEEESAAECRADWFFGLIAVTAAYRQAEGFHTQLLLFSRWTLNPHGKAGREKPAEDGKKEKEKKKGKRNKISMNREKIMLLLQAAGHALKRLLPGRMILDCRIGFEDPADTGTLCAVLAPLQAFLSGRPERYDVRIMPVFEDAEATGRFFVRGHAILWFIVWEALKLAISKPFRQDIFRWVRA